LAKYQLMKNLTIAQRLLVGFGLLLALSIGASIVSVIRLRDIRGGVTEISKSGLPALQATSHILRDVLMYRIYVNRHMLSDDEAEMKMIDGKCDEIAQSALQNIQKYRAFIENPEEEALYLKMEPALNAYRDVAKRVRAFGREHKNAEALALAKGEGATTYAAFEKAVSDCADYNEKAATATADKVADNANSSLRITLIMSAISLAAALTCGVLITRSINVTLQSMAGTLDDASAQVSSAATQVSSASQTLAEGSSQQAASLEETSASLEEMSSMTKRNTESAQQAKNLSGQTRGAADQGSRQMEEMRQAMDGIKSSSDEIAKIVKTIDEIAFQTNILALNAAVEAARAGEHGAGFAVVAEEVRALAQRSAQSAKETASKIETAIQKSGQGVEISAGVSKALGEIVEKARQVDEIVGEIARASQEQDSGIGQINTAVGQMDKVTQSNASSAEETAAAAEELNAQAAMLSDTIRELRALVGGAQRSASPVASVRTTHVSPKIKSPTAVPMSRAAVTAKPAAPAAPAPKVQRSAEPVAATSNSDLDRFFHNS
jgi:methyl-accepting chemotaxis protein